MNQLLGQAASQALSECVQENDKIVVLNCDVAKSVGIRDFGKEHPEQFIQLGISEQDMFLMAGGLAASGFIPVVTTFAKFGSLRVAEQISTFIAYPKQNVKILVSHGGISPAQDGVTHQAVEDLGVIRAIPGMTVMEPYDGNSCKALLKAAIHYTGPVYFRMNREKLPLLDTVDDKDLEIGKGKLIRDGKDIAVLAMGGMVSRAIEAAELLEKTDGISLAVYAIHTLKPLDEELVAELANRFGALVTAEEHNIHCGLGDAVSSIVTSCYPVPIGKVAIQDTFAQSGTYPELLHLCHLAPEDIAEKVRETMKRKKQ